jgi:hypothetical protein
MSDAMFEIQAQTLEELLINYLKETHGIIVSYENPLCCDDETRQQYIKKSNNDIEKYKDFLIDFYNKRITDANIMREFSGYANYLSKHELISPIEIDESELGGGGRRKRRYSKKSKIKLSSGGSRKRRKSKKRRSSRKRRRSRKIR